jgi:hypothetical protein
MATKGGDDVLSFYDTLYRAYASFPMLRQSVIATTGPSGKKPDSSLAIPDDETMMFDHVDVSPPSGSHAGPPNSAEPIETDFLDGNSDNAAMPVNSSTSNESRRARKLQGRIANRRNERKTAPPPKRPYRTGFEFRCTLCTEPSYFNRNGLLGHL